MLEIRRPQGSLNNAVTVVFDGKEGVTGGVESGTVKVLFSRGQSADDLIKDIVTRSRRRKGLVVVTDDRPLGYFVRALGAQVVPVRAFLKEGRGGPGGEKGPGKGRSAPPGEKRVSYVNEQRITSELKKIWLKEK